MRTYQVLSLMVLVCSFSGISTRADENATLRYRSMLERVKAGDLTVDLDEMRRTYAESDDYSSVSDPDLQKELIDAINK